MTQNPMPTLEEATVLRLQAGDVLLVTTDRLLTEADRAAALATLHRTLSEAGHPDIPVLLAPPGTVATVIRDGADA